jgi:4,5-DOPA dioxygenase extradiol
LSRAARGESGLAPTRACIRERGARDSLRVRGSHGARPTHRSIDVTQRMPSLFLGHGSPMNALQRNAYTESWAALGRELPKPRAVLSISAHWFVAGTEVTAMARPPTIHDFSGFPPELGRVKYPAPGDPQLAKRVKEMLAPLEVGLDERWGLDHGTWSVLCHVYRRADVPVIQLSIDARQAPRFHYELGQRLAPLRDDGVLILGSGNVVHNLRMYAWSGKPVDAFDWARRFEAEVREQIETDDDEPLIEYEKLGKEAQLSIPTPEHYLPLLYVLGTRHADDQAKFPTAGIEGGSISMLAVQLG